VAGGPGFAHRPFGVTMIAFLTLVLSLGSLVSLTRARLPESAPADVVRSVRQHAFWAGTWCALGLISAAGIFAMRRWGLVASVLFYLALIPLALVNERRLNPAHGHTVYVVFWVGLAALVIWHLTSKDTRAHFRKRA